jgi:type VI secretion system VasD/TssJ family lipoprotein
MTSVHLTPSLNNRVNSLIESSFARKTLKAASNFLAIASMSLLCSCSTTKSSSSPPAQEYKKGGISLNISADPQLNKFKNTPHTLLVCLYQLKDPNAFNQLADDPNQLSKLMECSKFDSSISYVKRIVVQPGQKLSEQRDLAEGTRFLGIAAGYYVQGNEKTTHLAPITSRSTTHVDIELGPNEITRVTVK